MREYVVSLFVIIIIVSCSENNDTNESKKVGASNMEIMNDNSFGGKWYVYEGFNENNSLWNKRKVKGVEFGLRPEWQLDTTKNFLFFSELGLSDKNSFIVVLRYSRNEMVVENMRFYMKEVYEQLESDTLERLLNSKFEYVSRENKSKAIYGEVNTILKSKKYKTLTYYIEDGLYVYDFSMKILLNKFDSNQYNIFIDFIYQFNDGHTGFEDVVGELKDVKEISF